MNKLIYTLLVFLSVTSCCPRKGNKSKPEKAPFVWENANVYFLLTDRFNNGDTSNDINFNRIKEPGKLRGFMGGDFKGIMQKIEDGYFTKLGVNALWFSPIAEQIHGSVDEGTGVSYGFHGYWAKDWTRIDPNWGTEEEFAQLVKLAHQHGIRILMDVVVNHTGPVTSEDPVYDEDFVRTSPTCSYDTYENTVTCTLVKNLPDVKTESNEDVPLPEVLAEKWENEERLEKEMNELNAFFSRTGYPKAPRFYIIKWLTDFVRKYGVDGYRIDTAKHTEETVWGELSKEARLAFAEWKASHKAEVLDDNDFFIVGEIYNYGISTGRMFDNGGVQVDYYANGMDALINFQLKVDVEKDYESIFSSYSKILHDQLKGKSVLNYLTSHDDSHSFDRERKHPFEAANKLLLCPGASQIYYGDETMRRLVVDGAMGDAQLRSFMNWDELNQNREVNGIKVQDVIMHYQKLGQFRVNNPAIGAGIHTMLSEKPYVFKREWSRGAYSNKVVVALDLQKGKKTITIGDVFDKCDKVTDYYSGKTVKVKNGKVTIDTDYTILLIAL